jgi:hypothetical protein
VESSFVRFDGREWGWPLSDRLADSLCHGLGAASGDRTSSLAPHVSPGPEDDAPNLRMKSFLSPHAEPADRSS